MIDDDYLGEVLDLVEAIPPGRVMTYGAIAAVVGERLGRGGPRQVGRAMARAGGGVSWWRVVNAAGSPPARHAREALARLVAEGCPLAPDGARVRLRLAAWFPPTQPSSGVALEIAVQDVPGARAAVAAGADRLELCVGLAATGGLTPSIALIEAVVAAVPVGVHVLVRPRPGGFRYDDAELAVQVRDVGAAIGAGAAGVVVGALTWAGLVDEDALGRLVAAANGREVTFHRALDTVADIPAAVAALAGCGVHRVLTSGGADRTIDGLAGLAATVAAAAGRVQVMAGGGVRPADIPAIVATGVAAVHLSASAHRADPAGPGGGSGGWSTTDPAVVAAARASLDVLAVPAVH